MRTVHAAPFSLLFLLAACGQVVGWPIDDAERPAVVHTSPADLADDVKRGASVRATFDQRMAPETLADSFTVRQGSTGVPGVVTSSGYTATFQPDQPLVFDTTYTATVDDEASNGNGLSLARPYTWSFTTGPLGAPTVLRTIPEADADSLDLYVDVFAMFSEPMDGATVDALSFRVSDGAGPVPGSVTRFGATGVFSPDAALEPLTVYTATVTTGATDLEGVELQADHVWSFTTGLDPEAPYVVYTDPGNLDIDRSIESQVFAVFSEPMLSATINGATFRA